MKKSTNQKKQKHFNKILSTSTTYFDYARPQWTSDSRINYISQNDFISYDIEEDQLHLVERKNDQNIQTICCIKFIGLIGEHPVRVIYTYWDQKNRKYQLVIIPSYSYSQKYQTITIQPTKILDLQIQSIGELVLLPELQSIFIPVHFKNKKSQVLHINLNKNLQSLLPLYNNDLQDNHQSENKDKIIKIFETKTSHQFIILTQSKVCYVKFITSLCCFQQICSIQVQAGNAQSKNIFILFLSQVYIFVLNNEKITIICLQDQRLFQLNPVHQLDIDGIVCAQDKLVYWLKKQPIVYQYKVNDKLMQIQHINTILLEQVRIAKILNITLSDSARNALILANMSSMCQDTSEIHGQPSIQFILFKLQLYTELKIPENSLYIQHLRYIWRNKRVNRLALPKINQKLYALTGSQVHSLQEHKMMGVMSFDIHPFGFYMVVSIMFNIKVYSLEPNSMTLMYSFSMHNVKRVQYSPDGSTIVLFSSRKIKLVDAYSFDLKEEYQEKNYNINDICMGDKDKKIYILLQNGTIISRSFLDLSIVKYYHIFGQGHQKLISIKIDQFHDTVYCLLENGKVITKNLSDLTANQQIYQYQDGQNITQIFIQHKNGLVIFGTKNGKIRIHINDPFQGRINFKRYYQRFVNPYQITSIVSSFFQNNIYVGSLKGDITIFSYNPQQLICNAERSQQFQKLLGKDFSQTNNKLINYLSFDFDLVSLAKLQGDCEQNNLSDKLQGLVDKIQQYGNHHKEQVMKQYVKIQQKYSQNKNNKENMLIYKEKQTKFIKLKNQYKNIYERFVKNRNNLIENWQTKMRQIYKQQAELNKQREKLKEKLTIELDSNIKLIDQSQNTLITQLQQEQKHLQLFIKKQKFQNQLKGDFDEFLVSQTDALKFYCQNLNKQLNKLKQKQRELNKNNGYLETAVKNMLSRKAQQQALLHRINQQLDQLSDAKQQQQNRIDFLRNNLKSTQETIHKIQNKVKNTPNNVISSDKADSDLCSYKIWMKDKTGQEVEELEIYFKRISEIFEKKSQQLVITSWQKNKTLEAITHLTQKRQNIKERLKKIRQKLVSSNFQESILVKNISTDMVDETYKQISKCQFQIKKAKKIASFERILDKAVDFQGKNIKNYKRKVNNLGSNNTQLLVQYQNLKFQNKFLIDKQKKYIQQIKFIKNQANVTHKKQNILISSQRTSIHQPKQQTPFQKYIRNKSKKTHNISSLLQTAVSTPRNLYTPRLTRKSSRKI